MTYRIHGFSDGTEYYFIATSPYNALEKMLCFLNLSRMDASAKITEAVYGYVLTHCSKKYWTRKQYNEFYGYVGFSRGTDRVYVITTAHETPEAAESARDTKIKALPRHVYLANYFMCRGVLKSNDPIVILDGYFGVAV